MSFDFFNPSNLAFGSKLTAAFTQLNNLVDEAEINLEKVFEIQSIITKFDRKNYIVPKPSKPSAPCRTNEVFDLLNDVSVIINSIEYSSNKLRVNINLFDRTKNRMTRATGETTLKEGYCYVKQASSNAKPDKTLTFDSSTRVDAGELLFQYRVDEYNNIILIGDISHLLCYPGDGNIYRSISKGPNLDFVSGTYTAEDYECVCLLGYRNDIRIELNGRVVLKGWGSICKRHCILYLKPGDKISGNIESGFRINYNI